MACNYSSFIFKGIFAWEACKLSIYISAVHFQNKSIFKGLLKPYWCPEHVTEENLYTNIAKTVSHLSRSWTGFETISAKLGAITHEAFLRQYPKYVTSDDEFNVLNHGDMWVNNFLFKYDASGQPKDIRIVSEIHVDLMPCILSQERNPISRLILQYAFLHHLHMTCLYFCMGRRTSVLLKPTGMR